MSELFHLYRTSELSEGQLRGICDLFEETFHHQKGPERFLKQFGNTGFDGGSYHVIAEEGGRVLATFSFIPYRYLLSGKEIKCVLGSDLIVSPEINLGIGGIASMYKLAAERFKTEDFKFLFGFPNDNMYDYDKVVMRMSDICILDFYVMPVNPGIVKKNLSCLQWLFYPCVRLAFAVCKACSSAKKISFPIEKVDDGQFRRSRYDERHHFLKLSDGGDVVYTVYQEEKMPVAYILDITPMSPKNFYDAFLRVAAAVKKEAAVVAYPANKLPFFSPIRVPRRFLPRILHMVLKKIDRNVSDEVLDGKNWNMNLSNFDVR